MEPILTGLIGKLIASGATCWLIDHKRAKRRQQQSRQLLNATLHDALSSEIEHCHQLLSQPKTAEQREQCAEALDQCIHTYHDNGQLIPLLCQPQVAPLIEQHCHETRAMIALLQNAANTDDLNPHLQQLEARAADIRRALA